MLEIEQAVIRQVEAKPALQVTHVKFASRMSWYRRICTVDIVKTIVYGLFWEIEANGVDIRRGHVRHIEAGAHGIERKLYRLFDPVQSFLFDGSHELTVPYQARGGVMKEQQPYIRTDIPAFAGNSSTQPKKKHVVTFPLMTTNNNLARISTGQGTP